MTFKERMETINKLEWHIKRAAKTGIYDHNETTNIALRDQIIDLACTYADELPEHEIEFDSISGDSKFEFLEDLAFALVNAAEADTLAGV